MKNNSILVIGSSNLDQIVKIRQFPAPGETITDGFFSQAFGGKGANQAVAASKAGGMVQFLSCLGADAIGDSILENLKNSGINTRFIRKIDGQASGIAQIWVDDKGENSIVVAPGANGLLSSSHVDEALHSGPLYKLGLLQMEMPITTVSYAVEAMHRKGIPVFLNLAPFQWLPKDIFSLISCLIVNETEASGLLGSEVHSIESAKSAATQLVEYLRVPNIIITLGPEGLVWGNGGTSLFMEAPLVNAIDTTAAGDVFCGYLASGFVARLDWRENLNRAQYAAALSVTRLGAQPSIPLLEEVNDFLACG